MNITAMLTLLSYVQFLRTYINQAKILPLGIKIFNLIQIIALIDIIWTFIFLTITHAFETNDHITSLLSLILLAIICLFVIRLLRSEFLHVRIIGTGSSFLIIGTIISVIFYVKTTKESSWLFQRIGTILELTVFAYGLSYRYWLSEREKQKYQNKLIIQLEENADLQLKVNRELSERVREATAELVAKNEAITDSIHYASLIQTAVLPPLDFINELGFESFILYKPQAIVSGDFYWGKKKNGRVMIAAADCTGHGVPGAFMSMLGHAFIEEIVIAGKTDNAAAILNSLREEVIKTMKQKGTKYEAKDGMDLSFCIIDKNAGQLEFAGANNDLYCIRNGVLTRIKADKMPIGISDLSNVPFNNQNINIREGDILYLFSDGFADQFGGPKRKRFMIKPLKKLLIQIHLNPMDQQRDILATTFEEWKGDNEQVDDVLVIGIKI